MLKSEGRVEKGAELSCILCIKHQLHHTENEQFQLGTLEKKSNHKH